MFHRQEKHNNANKTTTHTHTLFHCHTALKLVKTKQTKQTNVYCGVGRRGPSKKAVAKVSGGQLRGCKMETSTHRWAWTLGRWFSNAFPYFRAAPGDGTALDQLAHERPMLLGVVLIPKILWSFSLQRFSLSYTAVLTWPTYLPIILVRRSFVTGCFVV